MSNFNELAKEIHENAIAHGWYDKKPSFPETIAMFHSELSEALEEYREGNPALYYTCKSHDTRIECPGKYDGCQYGENEGCGKRKPCGIAIELADCIIRILDTCCEMDIDIDEVIRIKHEYNKTREYRHGGKVI